MAGRLKRDPAVHAYITYIAFIAGSRRVLATAMDDGQESLLALTPSTSLCPWVQHRFHNVKPIIWGRLDAWDAG